jgi:hypothetical protein
MVRVSIAIFWAGLTLGCGSCFGAGQAIPVDHREPITVRVMNGKNGLPLAHLHLTVIAGYDDRDIRHQLWEEEVSTGNSGEVRLPQGLVDFAFLQVLLRNAKACQKDSRQLYNLERIRNDGFSAPNDCGIVHVLDASGVLTIFAKGGGEMNEVSNRPRTPVTSRISVQNARPDPAPIPISMAVEWPVAAPLAHEIESLTGHSYPLAPVAGSMGTEVLPDSYEEMCAPER